ncbi:NUC188 domain-containing protein [Chytridium lagenaria]|nr:NUC188 domain-containing protein [Chytridium lagenaria]
MHVQSNVPDDGGSSGIGGQTVARSLNVEQFVETRAFEIHSMERALRNATEFTGNQRLFQTLPRHMRRRAASYNVKRMPQRLRQRAIDQIRESPSEPQVKKSRKARRKPSSIIAEFGKRSKEGRRWLETHLWHAKRMHMSTIWGFKIAERPNDKGERASYVSGGKQGTAHLFKLGAYPSGLICPVTFLWQPTVEGSNEVKLWIYVHPSALKEARENFDFCVEGSNVVVQLLGNDLQKFELMGPRAHAILYEVLRVKNGTEAAKVWEDLKFLRCPSSLPSGVVLSLQARDPRLRGSCKVPVRVTEVPEQDMARIHKLSVAWPQGLADSPLWDAEKRKEIIASKKSDKDINDLKSKLLVPGSEVTVDEPDVPILLIQRQPHHVSVDARIPTFEAGWDVIIPSQFAIGFWRALVYAGARVGGLRERRRLYFEAGVPCFPYDFPETVAYQEWAVGVGEEEREAWSRRPTAKRISYGKLGVDDPFLTPFYKLGMEKAVEASKEEVTTSTEGMAMQEEVKKKTDVEGEAMEEDIEASKETNENEKEKETDVVIAKKGLSPFEPATIISSPSIIRLLRQRLPHADTMQTLNDNALALVKKGAVFSPTFDLEKSLLRVRLTLLVKGTTGERGIIYSPVEDDLAHWTDVMQKKEMSEEESESRLDHLPSKDRIIGYVTTGGFSYTEGETSALGCCTVKGLQRSFYMAAGKKKAGKSTVRCMVLVRSTTGRICWPASFEIIC